MGRKKKKKLNNLPIHAQDADISIKQQRLAENIVQNTLKKTWEHTYEMLMDAGYSESSARKNAKEILQRKGLLKALSKMGFKEDVGKAVVSEIAISGKSESNRLRAAEIILKVVGAYAPEKHINMNMSFEEIIDKLNNNKI